MTEKQQKEKRITIYDIEQQIKNNFFDTKEQLIKYLNNLKENGIVENLDNQKIEDLLNLFDNLHKQDELPLDLSNYSSAEIADQNLIISKVNDTILNTQEGKSMFTDEFKQKQNEMTANNQNIIASEDEVFESMANHQKEEQKLLTLSEALLRDNIDMEILKKIRFIATNRYMNVETLKINPETGLFYNPESKTTYEVRKNLSTNSYEIYSDNHMVMTGYDSDKEDTPVLDEADIKEEQNNEQSLNKPKVRVLKKEDRPYMNNAAFTKIGLLIINVATFILLATMIILLNK